MSPPARGGAAAAVGGGGSNGWIVSGRGELHLAILIERMRREGFEFQVSQPQVINKEENGKTLTPHEEVSVEVPGYLTDILSERAAAYVRRQKPDLVFLDLLMPVMNGEEFLKALRMELGILDIPVVICSVNQSLARRLLDTGDASAVMPKLFTEKDLSGIIFQFLHLEAH